MGSALLNPSYGIEEGDMNIAFIGIGNMGRPMLANLLKNGFSAIAYDIVPAALDAETWNV